LPRPMPRATHDILVEKYFRPFHDDVEHELQALRERGAKITYHLDAHSMPSVGTKEHRDPGQRRADIVVSDCEGKSCSASFKDLVVSSYQAAGFQVAYNWPYLGGRVTETYGHPERGQEAIQVELNRRLYMDEQSKKLLDDRVTGIQKAIGEALKRIFDALPVLP